MTMIVTSEFAIRFLTKANDQEVKKYLGEVKKTGSSLFLPIISVFQTWDHLNKRGIKFQAVANALLSMIESGHIQPETEALRLLIKDVSIKRYYDSIGEITSSYFSMLEKTDFRNQSVKIPFFKQ